MDERERRQLFGEVDEILRLGRKDRVLAQMRLDRPWSLMRRINEIPTFAGPIVKRMAELSEDTSLLMVPAVVTTMVFTTGLLMHNQEMLWGGLISTGILGVVGTAGSIIYMATHE